MSCSNYYRTVKLFLLEDPGKSRVYDYTESVPVHIYQEDCRISLDELTTAADASAATEVAYQIGNAKLHAVIAAAHRVRTIRILPGLIPAAATLQTL